MWGKRTARGVCPLPGTRDRALAIYATVDLKSVVF